MEKFFVLGQVASLAHLVILVIVVAGILGIALIVLRQSGISIPPFIVSIGWIIIAVLLGVMAIRMIMTYL